ncbi:hypothetical protein AMTRI_Chr13g86620 [Amborella trichopoda]
MHLCMKYFMYLCFLSCCICGCMCMLYVACLSSVSLHVFHAFITVYFGKSSRLFSSILVCNRSRLFLLLQVDKVLHKKCGKFFQKIQEPFFCYTLLAIV